MSVLSPLADTATETKRVLHVDDEPGLADLTATFLERERDTLSVETASNATEGLELLAETDYDCIISDYDMPGRNGIEFLQAVREDHPDLPFILFTGKGSEEVASDAISAGVTDYLQKEGGTDQYSVLANRVGNAIEHYHSQQMIERSEEQLREIIDALPQFLYVVDEDGRYLLANEALADFHDMMVQEIEGAHVADLLDGDIADRFQARIHDVLASEERTRYDEVEIPDSRGEPHVIEPRVLPYELHGTDRRAVLGVGTDVTERIERERELERYEAYLEGSTDIITVLGEDGTVKYQSPSLTRILGYEPGELLGENGFDYIHPDDLNDTYESFTELIGNPGGTITEETRFRTADGEWRWLEIRGTNHLENPPIGSIITNNRDITERKQREQELRRKERRYQAVFNDPNILVGLIDTDGNVLNINRTAMAYVDATPDEVTGMPFWKTPWFAHSESLQDDVRDWIDRAARGEYVEFEADLVRPSGEPYTIEGVIRPVTDDAGEVVSLLISDRDITERKQRETSLTALNETTHSLMTADTREEIGEIGVEAAATILGLDASTIHVFDGEADALVPIAATDYARDLVGDIPTFRRGDSIAGRVYDRGETLALDDVRDDPDIYNPETPVRSELIVPLGDYGILMAGSETPEAFDRQDIAFSEILADAIAAAFEQTERTEQLRFREQELEAANTLLSTLFETLPVGVTILNSDGEIMQANQRGEEVLGLTEAEITERTYDDLAWQIVDEDGEPIPNDELPFARVERTGETVLDYEHGIVWPDGTERWLSVNAAPLTADTAGNEQVVTAISDITAQRDQARTLRRQNERLEEFASIVSHDLRNPLNVAEGHVELAREECDSDHLDAVAQAHGRMDTLITDLLTLAREGVGTGDVESVDLGTLVQNCWQNVATAETSLRTDLDRRIRADGTRLQQLLENLMRNAVEHGGDDVVVTVGELDDGFYIEDNGPGIAEDARQEVFETGYSTAEDGTGFGLAIVKQVAEAHDWGVRVTTGTEGGARFEISGVEFVTE
ncbi:PAS domain S-box protein [Halostella litorea]|uniref:PAS domain S-box protein n=1 Tax=Halostella litorea TaxID=2528831 RepID=UPI0010918DE8|nr:PAS domain S-box protein [Halostella litorea]